MNKRWNNNHNPGMNDFIRHYSAGPLRDTYHPNLLHKYLWKLFKIINAILRRITENSNCNFELRNKLEKSCLNIF